ncbi:XRE family transcriptional regulator [Vibrio aestuarianus]|uniref:LexA family protein n=1 Tax=Vibrio aestuarianus TaxID=28171 RepID=UPI0015936FEC|nr:S24 family peptidase [Vibrio aestuarianus]NGZ17532.1 XRE family transcriptional regulator [Vibrio aestuarianus]
MKELHEILKSERKRLKISQADAAYTMSDWDIDVSPATISRVETGWIPSWPIVNGYCRMFGWSLAELERRLLDGKESELIPLNIGKHIPIVTWVQAGGWSDSPFIPEHDQETTFVTGKTPKGCFALKVSGDSMTNCEGEHTFPDGSLVLVDPNRVATPKDFVVAVDEITQEATFKQLIEDCGRMYFKPLNTQYPVMKVTESTVVKGVVFRKIEDKNL